MSTGSVAPFSDDGTVQVTATTTTTTVTLPAGADCVVVYNSTAAIAFVKIGGRPATGANRPVPPGAQALFYAGPFAAQASVLLSAGSGVVYFTSGNGTAY